MKRQTYMKIAMALIPFLFLLLLEGGLRLWGGFAREPLFREVRQLGKALYQVNPEVARRYFGPGTVALPTLYPETFAREKSSQIYRIFCLGGSTTAGFPFDGQVPFPQQLRYLLSETYPEKRFEVINLGITAVNSYTVLDLLPEVLAQSPDLIVIYMGHNEFYGAYGSASAVSLGQSGGLVRFYLRLERFHLVQMLKRMVQAFTPAPQAPAGDRTLMESISADRAIGYGSEKYRRTLHNYRDNLGLILSQCAGRKVPVLLSNLVSNVRDLPPFGDANTGGTTINGLLARGDSLYRAGQFVAARKAYLLAWESDSSAARLWYRLGHTALQLGDSAQAAHYLYGARDRDAVRFRASGEVNRIIREAAERHQASFIDMEGRFRRRSPGGLPGNHLFCDHLHPDPQGYYLMANAFYEAIRRGSLANSAASDFQAQAAPYFVTDLDWNIGLMKAYKLVHRWPFPERPVNYDQYPPYGDPQSVRVAYDYLFNHHDWMKAHYDMADLYLQQEKWEKARREYHAVSLLLPENPDPYSLIARTYKAQQQWALCAEYYQKALQFRPNSGMLLYQLALAQWELPSRSAALANMEKAAYARDFTEQEQANAHYYLAGFLVESGRVGEARTALENLLARYPSFQPARQLLQQLRISPD